jgi:succinyl-diaminopimelate desuccinylase
MTDLLALTAELVAIPSVSHHEAALADRVEADLRRAGHLEVRRVEDTVVARTRLGRARRLVLAGHLDTVPPFDEAPPRLDGDTVWGLGAVDMKGGVAILLDLALTTAAPALDVTYVFYACEEVARRDNALGRLAVSHPDLLVADAAVLGEPTGGVVEAGCQGTMRAVVSVGGRRAHTSRPWTGVNAVHRLAPVLSALERYEPRRVVLDGCEYTEQLQAVGIDGGVAANVVPDRAAVTINYRFAPDRDAVAAEATLRELVGDLLDPAQGDALEVVDVAAGAPPGLGHPLLASLVATTGAPPRAKVGWTDVATFAALGVPATNFGPGDPLLAHTPDEHVSRQDLERVRAVLGAVLLSD